MSTITATKYATWAVCAAATIAVAANLPATTERAIPYVGLHTAEASAPDTPGLVVEAVDPAGPAAALRPGDVLQTFGDQLLFHRTQLRGLVASRTPGEGLKLRYVREGTTGTTSVVVIGRPEIETLTAWPQAKPAAAISSTDSIDGARVDVLVDQIRRSYESGVDTELVPVEQIDDFMRQVRHHIEEYAVPPNEPRSYRTGGHDLWHMAGDEGETGRILQDGDGAATLRTIEGSPFFTYQDSHGNVLFEGFLDEPDALQRLPRRLRPMLKQLQEPVPVEKERHRFQMD